MNILNNQYSKFVSDYEKQLSKLISVEPKSADDVHFLEFVVELLNNLLDEHTNNHKLEKQYDLRFAFVSMLADILQSKGIWFSKEGGKLQRQEIDNMRLNYNYRRE